MGGVLEPHSPTAAFTLLELLVVIAIKLSVS